MSAVKKLLASNVNVVVQAEGCKRKKEAPLHALAVRLCCVLRGQSSSGGQYRIQHSITCSIVTGVQILDTRSVIFYLGTLFAMRRNFNRCLF